MLTEEDFVSLKVILKKVLLLVKVKHTMFSKSLEIRRYLQYTLIDFHVIY